LQLKKNHNLYKSSKKNMHNMMRLFQFPQTYMRFILDSKSHFKLIR